MFLVVRDHSIAHSPGRRTLLYLLRSPAPGRAFLSLPEQTSEGLEFALLSALCWQNETDYSDYQSVDINMTP